MNQESLPWQLKIFEKTLKKKEKLALIRTILPDLAGKRCLDLGCAKGTISYFIRKEGGSWVHEDLDFENVLQTRQLTGPSATVIPPDVIPHKNSVFDVILSLDILEHLKKDREFVEEMARVLKPGGTLILSTPATGRLYSLNWLKRHTGLTPDRYGHVVEGYTLEQLRDLLNEKFHVEQAFTYSKFFTELVEYGINLIFIRWMRASGSAKRDGHISPGSAEEIGKYKKQLRFYSLIFPFIWLFTRLDKCLFWSRGYATLIIARRKP